MEADELRRWAIEIASRLGGDVIADARRIVEFVRGPVVQTAAAGKQRIAWTPDLVAYIRAERARGTKRAAIRHGIFERTGVRVTLQSLSAAEHRNNVAKPHVSPAAAARGRKAIALARAARRNGAHPVAA